MDRRLLLAFFQTIVSFNLYSLIIRPDFIFEITKLVTIAIGLVLLIYEKPKILISVGLFFVGISMFDTFEIFQASLLIISIFIFSLYQVLFYPGHETLIHDISNKDLQHFIEIDENFGSQREYGYGIFSTHWKFSIIKNYIGRKKLSNAVSYIEILKEVYLYQFVILFLVVFSQPLLGTLSVDLSIFLLLLLIYGISSFLILPIYFLYLTVCVADSHFELSHYLAYLEKNQFIIYNLGIVALSLLLLFSVSQITFMQLLIVTESMTLLVLHSVGFFVFYLLFVTYQRLIFRLR